MTRRRANSRHPHRKSRRARPATLPPAIYGRLRGNHRCRPPRRLVLRDALASALEMPVLLSRGPRGVHCFDEGNIGGPPKGLSLILTAQPACDVLIPGAGYSFGQLPLAFAMAAFDALQSRQQAVVRVHVAAGVESGLAEFEYVIYQALSSIRVLTR